ncbi:MAG: hypothetical protein P0116_03705 [Candidatus Nitrosocosmicus sp.]|nr:hypothetical protein [Candidatus Nitrosocosmicus sp.]
MGRWDDGGSSENGRSPENSRSGKKRNYFKLIRRVIFVGFAVVAAVVLFVYFSTAGLNIEIIQRGGPVETISVKLSNNNFNSINNVTVQFDDDPIQPLGSMGPFASIFVSPDGGDINFKKVVVKANNGQIEATKNR